ncbi:MAG: GtrA family protein [Ferruginibacter sp.]
MKELITRFIDFFYPPFRKMMPAQTFRYAACGGGNAVFGLFTYFIGYQYIFDGLVFDLGFYAFKPHTAAVLLSSFITFLIGFILNRYIVFVESNLRGRIQLFRYFLTFTFNLLVNIVLLKLLVEVLDIHPFISQMITILIVIAISYLTQRHFTFRVNKDGSTSLSELK